MYLNVLNTRIPNFRPKVYVSYDFWETTFVTTTLENPVAVDWGKYSRSWCPKICPTCGPTTRCTSKHHMVPPVLLKITPMLWAYIVSPIRQIFWSAYIYYVYAHSSCGISGIKAGLCETFLVLACHYEYDDVGENAEAPVQWLDASYCEWFGSSLFTWHICSRRGGYYSKWKVGNPLRGLMTHEWVFLFEGKSAQNFRPWRGSNSSAGKVQEASPAFALHIQLMFLPPCVPLKCFFFGLGCCPCY
jgi:hypothetical protein